MIDVKSHGLPVVATAFPDHSSIDTEPDHSSIDTEPDHSSIDTEPGLRSFIHRNGAWVKIIHP